MCDSRHTTKLPWYDKRRTCATPGTPRAADSKSRVRTPATKARSAFDVRMFLRDQIAFDPKQVDTADLTIGP